jgi:hypothetical protein
MGYRHDYEPVDERPLLYIAHPFWEDETERLTYEDAVEADRPRDEDTLLSYLARISAAVEGRYKGVLPKMRRPELSRVDRDRQLQKLRGQMPSRAEIL